MSTERTLLIEALAQTEDLSERVTDTAGVAAEATTLAQSATNLAEAASGEVSELRREVAARWVVDNLDDASVWLSQSVLDAAQEVYDRAHADGLAETKRLAAISGPRITKAELAQHDADSERLRRDFLARIVRSTATAAVARDGFRIFEDSILVVEIVSALDWSDGDAWATLPGYSWTTSYARR